MEKKENNFVSIKDIIKRDQKTNQKKNNIQKIYQVQSTKGYTEANLFYLGEYSEPPMQNILSFDHPIYSNVKCDMVSYVLTQEEIKVQKYFKMIGFLICMGDKIICSCDFVFVPNQLPTKLSTELPTELYTEGTFKIILFQKTKGVYKETIIKKYNEYCGTEESIYILTTVLIEDNVIEQYIENQ